MTVSKEQIQGALQELDPTDDGHWTSDSAPRLDVMKDLLDGRAVSRQTINEAAPKFNRTNAGAYNFGGEPATVATNDAPAFEQIEGPTETLELNDATEVVEAVEVPVDLSGDEAIERELAEARDAMNAAVARFSRARDAMDALVIKREQKNNAPLSDMIRQYHASVKQQRGIL